MGHVVEFAYYHLSKILAHTSPDLLLTNWPFHCKHLDFQIAALRTIYLDLRTNSDVELGDKRLLGFVLLNIIYLIYFFKD